jgi:hypothetical protein
MQNEDMAPGPSLAWIVGLALLGALAGWLYDPLPGQEGPGACADPLAYLFDMSESGVN